MEYLPFRVDFVDHHEMALLPVDDCRAGHPVDVGHGYADGGGLHPYGMEAVDDVFYRDSEFADVGKGTQMLERNPFAVMAGNHTDARNPAVGILKLPVGPEPHASGFV